MPLEIKDREGFSKLISLATELRVVRSGDSAKVKARTPGALYTFKTTAEDADSLVKGVKIPVQEF